ncbi:hypothetical protein ACPSKX_23075 [Moritella viscosa]|nr:hypothetical protein [Moritella viscosa]SHO12314.1 Putative uncharacterized protein [Moritella viscosa]SHO12320.1 Putative uncharacterized protein [Moritella viscosa]SHO16534.1 Putative uncharacterized protein [Moritella viscosa]SHO18351.1 Putative uncharacterized protein [Moritella viscosa]
MSESALGTDEIPTTIPGDEELALELELELELELVLQPTNKKVIITAAIFDFLFP